MCGDKHVRAWRLRPLFLVTAAVILLHETNTRIAHHHIARLATRCAITVAIAQIALTHCFLLLPSIFFVQVRPVL